MPPGGPEEQGGGAAAAYDAVAPSEPGLAAVPHTPGRLVELYDVQKAVGKGGYAVVYKGVRRQDGRIIAVKRVEVGQTLKGSSRLQRPRYQRLNGAWDIRNYLNTILEGRGFTG